MPTSAPPIILPSTGGGSPTDPITLTTPHHRDNDTERRKTISHFGHDVSGHLDLVVMRFDFDVHRVLDLMALRLPPTIMRR